MIYHFLNGPPILLRNNNVNKLRKKTYAKPHVFYLPVYHWAIVIRPVVYIFIYSLQGLGNFRRSLIPENIPPEKIGLGEKL